MKKEKNTIDLCMKYGCSCKLCPRNAKCDEELKEEKECAQYEGQNTGNRIRNNGEKIKIKK